MTEKHKVRSVLSQFCSEVRQVLPHFEGVKSSSVTHHISAMRVQTDMPQEPVVWTGHEESRCGLSMWRQVHANLQGSSNMNIGNETVKYIIRNPRDAQ